jgi:hypothetical protein
MRRLLREIVTNDAAAGDLTTLEESAAKMLGFKNAGESWGNV